MTHSSWSPAPEVVAAFDPATHTISYVVADPATGAAAIIDPVLDFDPAAARTSTASVDRLLKIVAEHGLEPFGHDDYEPGRRFYFFDWDGIEFEVVSYE